ncbi:zinc finger protein 436 [Nasonia vitripennis]|uniref:C2H2-type domain-containing protein n=1 Tax=Nasonia vitripennis TaxID=7425 RepID=A0A7M7LKR1_NASVI|nr:zinc finger protein 436 [Nasonia vitripennis]
MTNTMPEEEVQLTELRPVEQSWIKGTGDEDDKDGNATDGLKALRSFSRRQVDELEHFGAGYPRKRKADRWKHTEFAEDDGQDEEEELKKKTTLQGKKNFDELSDAFDEDDVEFYGVNGDFEYLGEERNDDEIYVYRQRDSCSSPEANDGDDDDDDDDGIPSKEAESEKLENVIEQQKAKPVPAPRGRGRPRKKKRGFAARPKIPAAAAVEKQPELSSSAIDSEKELQSKINDIIQANYLLEQENNNLVVESEAGSRGQKDASSKENDSEEPEKKYRCDLCEARFKGSGGLRNHYKVVHATGPLFKCDECGKEFPLKERLKLHVRTHTGFKPYKCPECDKSFARGGQLVQHRRTHSQVKPYSCELCSGTFTCAANLALHVKRHNGQKDHKCDICGRGFVRRDALKKHLECLHRDVKSFLCNICNKTFKGHLPQHMRTHAQDRPHGCATCGQRFAQKSQLTVHQRTHSGQRPFRCLVCWQAFAHSTALKLHTRRHTGERPFKCAECSAGFTQLPHWKKHMKCIHGRSEPYHCRRCNSFFRIKNELEAHEKDCQPEDNSSDPGSSHDGMSASALARFRNMSIEKMRLLLAVLLKRISKQERLDELGFGKRLIDEVLVDSLVSAGKQVVKVNGITGEFEALRKNLEVFLEWTVPKEHWENFRKMDKTPEEILETLTAT